MRNLIFCILGLLSFLILSPSVGLACSCSNPALEGKSEEEQIAEAREKAVAIFSGKVTEVIRDKSSGNEFSGAVEARFDVLKSWKGVNANQISVFTASSSSLCGYTFEVGESYLVYAYEVGDEERRKLNTNICTRTRRLDDAKEDLRVLEIDKASNENPCNIRASRNPGVTGAKEVPTGNWGGEHISLQVAENSSTFEMDCAHGTINQALTLDADNRFEARADYVRERGGPVREGQRADSHPARFKGWSDGKRMTLTITRTDTGQLIGDFNLELGRDPRMTKCL